MVLRLSVLCPNNQFYNFFIEVCGFVKLLDFAENKIPADDNLFRSYLGNMRERIKKFKCEEIQTNLKGVICGYFKTSEYKPIRKGKLLPYLGVVREKRYMVRIDQLKWEKESWRKFLQEVGLL